MSKPDHLIVIIGAGLSGIGTAMKLRRAGIDDFVIVERADDVGGTWRDNTYPGVGMDAPSFMYQYGDEMSDHWSKLFAPGAEIKEYIDRVVDKHDLRRHLRLGTEVAEARWDDRRRLWQVHLADGTTITSRFAIAALGAFTNPRMPDIKGIDSFQGAMMHSARWNHETDLTGKRVGVIGTGLSAIQIVPAIADRVESLTVYQRTPTWILPRPDIPIRKLNRVLSRLPGGHRGARLLFHTLVEVFYIPIVLRPGKRKILPRLVETACKAFLRTQIPDPQMRRALTPSYGYLCKIPAFSNTFYRALRKPHSALECAPIQEITPTGIRTADGAEREFDVLVMATGFPVWEPENAPPIPVHGRNGFELRRFWAEHRAQAYEGVSVPGLPNFFISMGPYALTGGSWMHTIESSSTHAVRVIAEAQRRGADVVEIRQEHHDRFFAEMCRRSPRTVFFTNDCSGVNSYLFDQHGDSPSIRPSLAVEVWWRSNHFDLDHYHYETAAKSRTGDTAPELETAG